jgi:hypothetical protein
MPPLAQKNRHVITRKQSGLDLAEKTMVNQLFSQWIIFQRIKNTSQGHGKAPLRWISSTFLIVNGF